MWSICSCVGKNRCVSVLLMLQVRHLRGLSVYPLAVMIHSSSPRFKRIKSTTASQEMPTITAKKSCHLMKYLTIRKKKTCAVGYPHRPSKL